MAGRPKSRAQRLHNPGIGDYFRAGKKAALDVAESAATGAKAAAERARKAASDEAEARKVDSPEKALRVLAATHGYELVKKNPKAITRQEAVKKAAGIVRKAERLVPSYISGTADESAFLKLRDDIYRLAKASYHEFNDDDGDPYREEIMRIHRTAEPERRRARAGQQNEKLKALWEEARAERKPYDWMRHNPGCSCGGKCAPCASRKNGRRKARKK